MKITEIPLQFLPEPNIAEIRVKMINDHDLVASYPIKTDEAVRPITSIVFNEVVDYYIGPPNDEGFYEFYKETYDYPSKGFELDKLYEVEGLDNEFAKNNTRLLQQPGYKHYIMFVKENCFQCIAKDCVTKDIEDIDGYLKSLI